MSSHGWLWNVTKQLRLSSTDQEISLFRSSLLQEVLIGSVILQLPVALPLPCQRRAAPHPKKGETSSQGRASLTRPVLSRAGLLNKDQTQRVCTSPGLLYNRPLCHRARAVRTQLRGEASLTYCTQPCLQRAFTALHISSLMDDDDWARALMPVYITVGHTHTFLNDSTVSGKCDNYRKDVIFFGATCLSVCRITHSEAFPLFSQ